MMNSPSSDHDWTVHSINIHGVFFERWCQQIISGAQAWKVKSTNYPVEFPPPNGSLRGKESTLDIRAERRLLVNQASFYVELLLTLLIECKKNNPDFVNWIFFPKPSAKIKSTIFISHMETVSHMPKDSGWDAQVSLGQLNLSVPTADEARETRGSYQAHQKRNKTKTSNAAVSDAAYQIALATQAIVSEEQRFLQHLGSSPGRDLPMPWKRQAFLPTIVTSAQLFTCEFHPSDIDPATGEIPYAKATITERPFLIYEYPLPRHLQQEPSDLTAVLTNDRIELFVRMPILVVHSAKFADFLDEITREVTTGYLRLPL
jgi:hypothetical protein